MTLPDVAIGAIVVALVGAAMTFISTVLSKEQKTSEFRQSWIDSLRADIASYIAISFELSAFAKSYSNRNSEEKAKFIDDNCENFIKLHELATKILLRLNPEEHKIFYELVKGLTENIADRMNNQSDVDRVEQELMSQAHNILRSEWKRVKQGEFTFRATKYFAMFIITSCIAVGICLSFPTITSYFRIY